MRAGIRILAPLALVACSSSAPSGPDDLSFAYSDFTVTNTGCTGLVTCILEEACEDRGCISLCRAKSTAPARALYDQALACGQKWCLGEFDAGTSPCVLSGGTLVDAQPGSNNCNACLYNSLAALFGLPCIPANSPDCNPGMCTGDYAQCAASKP